MFNFIYVVLEFSQMCWTSIAVHNCLWLSAKCTYSYIEAGLSRAKV